MTSTVTAHYTPGGKPKRRSSGIESCLNAMDRPVPMALGEVKPCATGCGREIASRATCRRFPGVSEHRGYGLCPACAQSKYRGSGRKPMPYAPPKTPVRRAWRERAVCVDADPELFDEAEGRRAVPPSAELAARRFCVRCPVRAACHREAEANSYVGVWAGRYRTGIDATHRSVDLLERGAVA